MATGKTLEQFREQHDPTFIAPYVHKLYRRKLRPRAKVYIVTAAQNATPVQKEWWEVLKTMAAHRNAELLVIPIRYKNATSRWTASQANKEWYASEVRDYLWNVHQKLHPKLVLMGDFKIQPTASDPLTGAEAISLAASGIIGHTKLQMRSIATPASRMAKILTTTGACTLENYSDTRAGRIGAFHHSLSAVIVEIEGPRFHLRHVHFDKKTRSATDLDVRYLTNGYGKAPRPLAVSMGDTHVRSIDPLVEKATFGPQGLIETLNPRHVIYHDVLDAHSCSPHHKDDPFTAIAKRKSGGDDVAAEVNEAIDFIAERTKGDRISVVVGSNHNDMLGRWVKRNDWREDPTNALFYLDVAKAMALEAKQTRKGAEYPDPFATLVRARNLKNVRVLDEDESFMLAQVECGMHGNRGPNGSRGSTRNLRRIGVKSIKGHDHTPTIDEGCYSNGTSTVLRLEYNKGPSSWLQAHTLLHDDGKRQIVIFVDGYYRS